MFACVDDISVSDVEIFVYCYIYYHCLKEYIRPGMRMLFRDGRVRGVGIITSIPKVQAVK